VPLQRLRDSVTLISTFVLYYYCIITEIKRGVNFTASQPLKYVEWYSEQDRAFKEVKKILSSEPIFKLPDLNREIILSTDASNKSLDACMMQEYDGVYHPVLYASKKMLPREQNYSVGERGVGCE